MDLKKLIVLAMAVMFIVSFNTAWAKCPDVPDPPDIPDVPDAPAADASESDTDANMFWRKNTSGWTKCDTSWKAATYPECYGIPYELLLQDEELTGAGWAVPVIRTGFDTK